MSLILFLIGSSETATKFSAVDTRKVLVQVYVLSGLLCGLAGMVMLSRFNSANARSGSSLLLLTILIAVLGGTDPNGGFGKISGIVLSLLTPQLITSGINSGYTFFFYRDDQMHAFATIASSGNAYEQISNLDRPGVYRLNLGVSKQTFQALFGRQKIDISAYDFTALDRLMPHPDYSSQSFICVLSPSEATFARIRPLLAEAYEIAVKRYNKRNLR